MKKRLRDFFPPAKPGLSTTPTEELKKRVSNQPKRFPDKIYKSGSVIVRDDQGNLVQKKKAKANFNTPVITQAKNRFINEPFNSKGEYYGDYNPPKRKTKKK